MKNYLSTGNDLYLIYFHAKTSGIIFDGGDSGVLGDLIELYGKNGIIQIKRFNTLQCKFKRVGKAMIANLFMWDTHSIIELKKCNYIK